MTASTEISARLADVRARISQAALSAGRHPEQIDLVAVSKTHPAEEVQAAIDAGQRLFGENRVQEAAGKFPALRADCPDLRLHLIGPLQTNKIDLALQTFDVIETLDRPKLAEKLAQAYAAGAARRPLFIQVNTGAEPQKAGIDPQDADRFIDDCRTRLGLPVVGLMCIPPADEPPAPHFALLATIARRHRLDQLSMGMSQDFPIAVSLGATAVRVGSAIFGTRPPQNEPR